MLTRIISTWPRDKFFSLCFSRNIVKSAGNHLEDSLPRILPSRHPKEPPDGEGCSNRARVILRRGERRVREGARIHEGMA
ncbi:MAG: hypothetical protein KA369_24155 [Spirochaetes bacterium]|nr:hypothetical protein [Spirochaetota bacterium]